MTESTKEEEKVKVASPTSETTTTVWDGGNKCIACREVCSEVAQQRAHEMKQKHKSAMKVYEFFQNLPEHELVQQSRLASRYSKRRLSVVGLESLTEFHTQNLSDPIFWACSVCNVAGGHAQSADDHIDSKHHIEVYLSEYETKRFAKLPVTSDKAEQYENLMSLAHTVASEQSDALPTVMKLPDEENTKLQTLLGLSEKDLALSLTKIVDDDKLNGVLHCKVCNELMPWRSNMPQAKVNKILSVHANSRAHATNAALVNFISEIQVEEVLRDDDDMVSRCIEKDLQWHEEDGIYYMTPCGQRFLMYFGEEGICTKCYCRVTDPIKHCSSESHIAKFLADIAPLEVALARHDLGPARRAVFSKQLLGRYLENESTSKADMNRLPTHIAKYLSEDLREFKTFQPHLVLLGPNCHYFHCGLCCFLYKFPDDDVGAEKTWSKHIRTEQHLLKGVDRSTSNFDHANFVPWDTHLPRRPVACKVAWEYDDESTKSYTQKFCDVGLEYLVHDEDTETMVCILCAVQFPVNAKNTSLAWSDHTRTYEHALQYMNATNNVMAIEVMEKPSKKAKQDMLLEWLAKCHVGFARSYKVYSAEKYHLMNSWPEIRERAIVKALQPDNILKECYAALTDVVDQLLQDGDEKRTTPVNNALRMIGVVVLWHLPATVKKPERIIVRCDKCSMTLIVTVANLEQELFVDHTSCAEHHRRMISIAENPLEMEGMEDRASTYIVRPYPQDLNGDILVWRQNNAKEYEYVERVLGMEFFVERRYVKDEMSKADFYCKSCCEVIPKRSISMESHTRSMRHVLNYLFKMAPTRAVEALDALEEDPVTGRDVLASSLRSLPNPSNPDECIWVYDPISVQNRKSIVVQELMRVAQRKKLKEQNDARKEEEKKRLGDIDRKQKAFESERKATSDRLARMLETAKENARLEKERKERDRLAALERIRQQQQQEEQKRREHAQAALRSKLKAKEEKERQEREANAAKIQQIRGRLEELNKTNSKANTANLLPEKIEFRQKPTKQAKGGFSSTFVEKVPTSLQHIPWSVPNSNNAQKESHERPPSQQKEQWPRPVEPPRLPSNSSYPPTQRDRFEPNYAPREQPVEPNYPPAQRDRPADRNYSPRVFPTSVGPPRPQEVGFQRPSLITRSIEPIIMDIRMMPNKETLLEFILQNGAEEIPRNELPSELSSRLSSLPGVVAVSDVYQVVCKDDPSMDSYYCTKCSVWDFDRGIESHLQSEDHMLACLFEKLRPQYNQVSRERDPHLRRSMLRSFCLSMQQMDPVQFIRLRMLTVVNRATLLRVGPLQNEPEPEPLPMPIQPVIAVPQPVKLKVPVPEPEPEQPVVSRSEKKRAEPPAPVPPPSSSSSLMTSSSSKDRENRKRKSSRSPERRTYETAENASPDKERRDRHRERDRERDRHRDRERERESHRERDRERERERDRERRRRSRSRSKERRRHRDSESSQHRRRSRSRSPRGGRREEESAREDWHKSTQSFFEQLTVPTISEKSKAAAMLTAIASETATPRTPQQQEDEFKIIDVINRGVAKQPQPPAMDEKTAQRKIFAALMIIQQDMHSGKLMDQQRLSEVYRDVGLSVDDGNRLLKSEIEKGQESSSEVIRFIVDSFRTTENGGGVVGQQPPPQVQQHQNPVRVPIPGQQYYHHPQQPYPQQHHQVQQPPFGVGPPMANYQHPPPQPFPPQQLQQQQQQQQPTVANGLPSNAQKLLQDQSQIDRLRGVLSSIKNPQAAATTQQPTTSKPTATTAPPEIVLDSDGEDDEYAELYDAMQAAPAPKKAQKSESDDGLYPGQKMALARTVLPNGEATTEKKDPTPPPAGVQQAPPAGPPQVGPPIQATTAPPPSMMHQPMAGSFGPPPGGYQPFSTQPPMMMYNTGAPPFGNPFGAPAPPMGQSLMMPQMYNGMPMPSYGLPHQPTPYGAPQPPMGYAPFFNSYPPRGPPPQ